MNAFWGMDVERLRAHGDRLGTSAQDVRELTADLHSSVESVHWVGPDSADFRRRWSRLASGELSILGAALEVRAALVAREAEAQELASSPHGITSTPQQPPISSPGLPFSVPMLSRPGPGGPGKTAAPPGGAPAVPVPEFTPPWLPRSSLAAVVSEAIGWGFNTTLDGAERVATGLGLETDGIEALREDGEHVGGLMEGWVSGRRVPTVAELASSALLLGGSALVAPVELVTDVGWLDPRTEVTVHEVHPVTGSQAPQGLADLVLHGDEARRTMPGRADGQQFTGKESGQIRIQEVRAADGGSAYIVHAPPTGGHGITDARSWGAQGNSAGWDSNLRSMSGQESAAIADVKAAMAAPGPDGRPLVPPGAEVMIVGHSQGGLTASRLIADPGFNDAGGGPGTYDVTHSFSVGSPVEAFAPAQETTRVLNLGHGADWAPTPVVTGVPFLPVLPGAGRVPDALPDPVPWLDLDGYRMDGSRVTSAEAAEVVLDAPRHPDGEHSPLHNTHNTVLRREDGSIDPRAGYYGTLVRHEHTDPALVELRGDLQGRYLGEGVVLVADHVVEVGREDLT